MRAAQHPQVAFLVHAIVSHDDQTTAGEIQKRARTIAWLIAQLSLNPARKEP